MASSRECLEGVKLTKAGDSVPCGLVPGDRHGFRSCFLQCLVAGPSHLRKWLAPLDLPVELGLEARSCPCNGGVQPFEATVLADQGECMRGPSLEELSVRVPASVTCVDTPACGDVW